MSGFDAWGVMTANSPSDEIARRNIGRNMQCHVTDEFLASSPLQGGLISAGGYAGLAHLSPEPYAYRYLHPTDRPMMGLNPNNCPGTKLSPTIPTGSTDAMTTMHLGGRGDIYGTDRISVKERLLSAQEYMRSSPNSTQIVRISTTGLNYLTHREITQALNRRITEMERQLLDTSDGEKFLSDLLVSIGFTVANAVLSIIVGTMIAATAVATAIAAGVALVPAVVVGLGIAAVVGVGFAINRVVALMGIKTAVQDFVRNLDWYEEGWKSGLTDAQIYEGMMTAP